MVINALLSTRYNDLLERYGNRPEICYQSILTESIFNNIEHKLLFVKNIISASFTTEWEKILHN